MCFTNSRIRKSGFTLVEMLLVVAMISLLISILLPALGKVKDKAQTTICQSNLKSINGATIQFATDNARMFPAGRNWVTGSWTSVNGVKSGTLYKYMGENEAAYVCPEFLDSRSWWEYNQNGVVGWTYSLNEYFGESWQGKNGVRTMTGVQQPSEVLMYSDENAWKIPGLSNYTINNGAMGIGQLGNPGSIVDSIGSYHEPLNGDRKDGYSNVLYVDGHVDLVHVSETKLVVTPNRYRNAWGWTEGAPY